MPPAGPLLFSGAGGCAVTHAPHGGHAHGCEQPALPESGVAPTLNRPSQSACSNTKAVRPFRCVRDHASHHKRFIASKASSGGYGRCSVLHARRVNALLPHSVAPSSDLPGGFPFFSQPTQAARASGILRSSRLPLVHCLCIGKGVCSIRVAFLSTAAPRRGTLPDLEQQPSPKLFL